MMPFRRTLGHILVVAAAVVTVHGAPGSRQQADSLARKIAIITQRGTGATVGDAQPAGVQRTAVTEDEVNSWFVFRGRPYLPTGLSDPSVTMIGDGAMKGVATVDLEALGKRRSKGGGMLDLWSYLGGRVPVVVTGTLKTKDGRGQFNMQSAEVAGLPVPKALLQELVSLYSSSPDQGKGISFEEPFELPAKIRQIDIGRGQLVVVQ